MLGAIGFGLLVGAIYLMAAIPLTATIGLELGKAFGTFIFASQVGAALPALSFSALNALPVIALNTVLTAVGNFLTGGDLAVAQYKQQVDHAHNNQRIRNIEGREQKVEQAIHMLAQHGEKLEKKFDQHTAEVHAESAKTPRHVKQILEEGPKVKVDKEASASHAADVVANRLEAAEHAIG